MRLLCFLLLLVMIIHGVNARSIYSVEKIHSKLAHPATSTILSIRGGKTKRPGLIAMIKSFWYSLIDPGNLEGLKEEGKNKSSKSNKKGGMFGAKKPKGRSLKD